MAVPHSVRTSHYNKCSCKLPVLAVFIRKSGGIKCLSDLLVYVSVIAPLEPGLPSPDIQSKEQRTVVYRDSGVQKFRLFAIFQMDDGQRTLSQRFAMVFTQVDVIHIVIIQDKSCAVLMDLRLKFHLCRDCRIYRGQFSG